MESITSYLIQSTVDGSEVKAWEEVVLLPTYGIGKEEKNPIFIEKRVYQGSSGVVYPYPVIEKIEDEKHDKPYHALFIENEYLKIMILPELGGRVHMAYDKVKQRHFVYYNQVVKPALVGLTGPWISGGIEFNWPQHHRPSTYLPTDYTIEEHVDGSKTVWCNEVERMFHTKGMVGFTLYPGKAFLEVNAKIFNRTMLPQTFLWWANPAVAVHDYYFSVFPPDVNAVYDHGKRDVSTFPIATGEYYKCDYSAGVDISRYKNIPVPTSYMAINSKYDFVGGYEQNIEAGLLHVANHHINAGKKQWTWGNGDFGKAWDRNLTDEDGPYIELMTGMYCDNQPDFTWIQPYEEKSWSQYFMPYAQVGMVKNATKEAIIGVERIDKAIRVILYTTSINKHLQICTYIDERIADERTIDEVAPASPATLVIPLYATKEEQVKVTVVDGNGRTLVSYVEEPDEIKPIPEPAKAAKSPKDILSVEQLYLTGLHLEQYRHATYSPLDYYMEALNRDEGSYIANNAVGLWYMRRGDFSKAQPYFERAIETLTERNPNPIDEEPHYNLGWCLKMLGKIDQAYDAFFKATWSAAQQDSGYFSLAQIDTLRGSYPLALEYIERSLIRNWHNHKSRHLKAAILRKMGASEKAMEWIEESLKLDLFNVGCRYERYLILMEQDRSSQAKEELAILESLLRGNVHTYMEYAFDYSSAGLFQEAFNLLKIQVDSTSAPYPTSLYALSYFARRAGNLSEASIYLEKGSTCDPSYCFPNMLDEVVVLREAIEQRPNDSNALYYLGNFWYSTRQYHHAIVCWERSVAINPMFPTALRNLALAYYNKSEHQDRALPLMEKAFRLDTTDARMLMELDQLYKKLQLPHAERLNHLQKYSHLVEQRDDLYIELITLLNQLGMFAIAKDLMEKRKFHPWEGGEGKVTGQYLTCRLELAKIAMKGSRYEEAIELLKQATNYPPNLGEGKLAGAEENDIYYLLGCAYIGLKDNEKAIESFRKATVGSVEPSIAFFYNDAQPDKIYYQGLAWLKLGDEQKAKGCFYRLIKHGEKHLFDDVRIDYFAVSLPELLIWDEDLSKRNQIHCKWVMGLGNLGLGEKKKAARFFNEVLSLDINHQGAMALLNEIQNS